MNNFSSIGSNQSISFNQEPHIIHKTPENKEAKLVSLYSLQLISEEHQHNLSDQTENQPNIISPSQSSKKYIKFKGFLSDKKRENKNTFGSPKTMYESPIFDTDRSRIDFGDHNNFSFDVQALDIQENHKPKIKKIRTSENILKTEETTLEFKPKHTFVKVKTCLTPKNMKYSKFYSPHNVSLPEIPNENEERIMKHQQSSPNMLNIENFQRKFEYHEKYASDKSIVIENEKITCKKCEQFEIQKESLYENLQKVKNILKESKQVEDNLKVFQELCLRSFNEEIKNYQYEIKKLMSNLEKNIAMKEFHKSRTDTLFAVFHEPLMLGNMEEKCEQIEVATFIDDLSNEIMDLFEKEVFLKNEKRKNSMGEFGKIKKNGQSKIQEVEEMNVSMEKKELCLEYNYEISKIYEKQCDLSIVSVENVNDEILSNLENFKNQSSKWEESVPNLNTPKFELLTQSYDFKLEREIDAFVENKSELVGFEEKFLDGSGKMIESNVDEITNDNFEDGKCNKKREIGNEEMREKLMQ